MSGTNAIYHFNPMTLIPITPCLMRAMIIVLQLNTERPGREPSNEDVQGLGKFGSLDDHFQLFPDLL